MNGLSLFSGIGGLDLAFTWAGGNILAFCEIEKYCQKVLHKHWPDTPIFSDIHNLNKEALLSAGISSTVDIIYGGFPCQPFSVAGDQKGKDDTRYLWPEFSRLVEDIKPRWVVAENVPGILPLAADDICRDLERQGYSVGIWDYEAAAVGAKHRRERIFFVAHSGRSLRQRRVKQGTLRDEAQEGASNQPERPSSTPSPNPNSALSQGEWFSSRIPQAFSVFSNCGRWQPEPRVDRVVNGLPNRVDRLRALGKRRSASADLPDFQGNYGGRGNK